MEDSVFSHTKVVWQKKYYNLPNTFSKEKEVLYKESFLFSKKSFETLILEI